MILKKGSLAPCSQCGKLKLVVDPEHHVCERCKHPHVSDGPLVLRKGQTLRDWGRTQHLDPDDERVKLIDQFAAYLRDSDRGQEIVRRYPWTWDGVEQIERELAGLTFEQTRSRINQLLKRLSCARGKRHTVESSKSRQDRPYWQEADFGQDAKRDGADHRGEGTNTNTNEGDETMAIYVEAPQMYELVERGEHPAKVSALSEPEVSKFDPEKQSIKVTFELTGGPFEGQRLSKFYTLSLSKMASLGKLYRTLLGKVEPGERVDIEKLIGCACAVQVTHKLGDDDENYAVVQDVFAPAKKGKAGSAKSKAKEPALAGAEVPF